MNIFLHCLQQLSLVFLDCSLNSWSLEQFIEFTENSEHFLCRCSWSKWISQLSGDGWFNIIDSNFVLSVSSFQSLLTILWKVKHIQILKHQIGFIDFLRSNKSSNIFGTPLFILMRFSSNNTFYNFLQIFMHLTNLSNSFSSFGKAIMLIQTILSLIFISCSSLLFCSLLFEYFVVFIPSLE